MRKLLLFVCFITFLNVSGQVGINTTAPDASSILDISSGDKGILVPRISLSDVGDTTLDGTNTAATGLLIYNTNASTSGGDGIGYYYFNGSSWERLTTSASSDDDRDWFEEGTTTSPDAITDDIFTQGNVAIGKTTADFPLDIESATTNFGAVITLNGSDDGTKSGLFTAMTNTGNAGQRGVSNNLFGDSDGPQIGVVNTIVNSGINVNNGVYNVLSGNGTGERNGVSNMISGTGTGVQRGTYTSIENTGNGNHFGSYNLLAGAGAGIQYGAYNQITNSGNNVHYGSYQDLSGNGDGPHYGAVTSLAGTGAGIHYGSFTVLGGSGNGNQLGYTTLISNTGNGIKTGHGIQMSGTSSGNRIGVNTIISNGTSNNWGFFADIGGVGDGEHIGLRNQLDGTGSGIHKGISNAISGSGSGNKFGVENELSGNGDGILYGVESVITNAGSGVHYGTYNELTGGGDGDNFGTNNFIPNNGNGNHFGTRNSLTGAGSGEKRGVENSITGAGSGVQTGVYNLISNNGGAIKQGMYSFIGGTGSANHYGNRVDIISGGTGNRYGFSSSLFGATSGLIVGVENTFSGNGTGNRIGKFSSFGGAGSGDNTGVYSLMGGSGDGNNIGVITSISRSGSGNYKGVENTITTTGSGTNTGVDNVLDGNGSGEHIGSKSVLSGSGSGAKYGTYNSIDSGAGGAHFGVYSNVLKSGSYAGYFLGNLAVGTSGGNIYTFPSSRGAANALMQTDGSGNLSWVDPDSFASVLGATNGVSLSGSNVVLGGTLTGNTAITAGASDLDIVLSGTGGFTVVDGTTDVFQIDNLGVINAGNDMYWRDESSAGTALALISDDGNDGRFRIYEDGFTAVDLDTNSQFIFNERGADRNFRVESENQTSMFLIDAGNDRIGVREAIPNYDIHLKQSSTTEGGSGGIAVESSSSTNVWKVYHSGSHISFAENGVRRAYVTAGTGAYMATSDRRLKKDIEKVGEMLPKLSEIDIYTYRYKDQDATAQKTLGVMAQEVKPQFPELVQTNEDGNLAMNYDGLSVVAIKAIKEQQTQLDAQAKKIEALEKLVEKLLDGKE